MKKIYLAGGCFWGVEEYLSYINGVVSHKVGYANSSIYYNIKGIPLYKDVCTGTTGLAEVVEIVFNEEIVSLKNILTEFFKIIDPTSLNKQGNDVGSQYRVGIYYTDVVDFTVAKLFIESQQPNYVKNIVVEVEKLRDYYEAEDYHQEYLKKNINGYCHIPKSLIQTIKNKVV